MHGIALVLSLVSFYATLFFVELIFLTIGVKGAYFRGLSKLTILLKNKTDNIVFTNMRKLIDSIA